MQALIPHAPEPYVPPCLFADPSFAARPLAAYVVYNIASILDYGIWHRI